MRESRQGIQPYRLSVVDGRADAARLQHDIGLTHLFRCPQCQEPLVLELIPDHTRPLGHWFAARFLCQKCGRFF